MYNAVSRSINRNSSVDFSKSFYEVSGESRVVTIDVAYIFFNNNIFIKIYFVDED